MAIQKRKKITPCHEQTVHLIDPRLHSTVPSSNVTFFLKHSSNFFSIFSKDWSGLLSEEKAKAFLHRHPVSGELVVRGESSRVSRAGRLTIWGDFLLEVAKVMRKIVEMSKCHPNRNCHVTKFRI